MQRALVVSVHDVAPATRPRVEEILAQLARAGVARCSLLVVPDYHRTGHSLGEPAFADWLQALQADGHEIVVHGFYHERARREGESARQKLVTRVYTADEGEFYDLDYEEASRLLRGAQDDFAAHGFHPTGFIAPAWLLGTAAERAVVDAGFRYTTTLRGIRDFTSGEEIFSQSLVYSVRSAWRRVVSRAWNRMLFQRLTKNQLLRLGLHPPDVEHPRIWRQINALVAEALHDRRPATYQDWLEHHSAFRNPHSELA
ncbi:MAG: polysaccharide deacetylase family protein [Chthoniobacterales bacterium]